MKSKPRACLAAMLPPAWQAGNGLSIIDVVLAEARKRSFAAHEIVTEPPAADPRLRNQVMIAGRRCQILPGRILELDEGHGEGMLRLHPAFEWAADFLIYVVKGSGLFVLPAMDSTMGGTWAIDARLLERHKDAWQVFGTATAFGTRFFSGAA